MTRGWVLCYRCHVVYAKAKRVPVYVCCSLVAIAVGCSAAAAVAALAVSLLIRDAANPVSKSR